MASVKQIASTLGVVVVGMMVGFNFGGRSLMHEEMQHEGQETATILKSIVVKKHGEVIEVLNDAHNHIRKKRPVSAENAAMQQGNETLSNLFDNTKKHSEKRTRKDMAVVSARIGTGESMDSEAGLATQIGSPEDPEVAVELENKTKSGYPFDFADRLAEEVEHDLLHPHIALFFMCTAICIGALTQWAIDHFAPFLPYSSVLMLEGLVLGMYEAMCIKSQPTPLNEFWHSLLMWTEMDPHLLMYVFLPPLIFADVVNVQWHYFKRCFFQCILLAGPGVLVSAFIGAAFFRFAVPLWFGIHNWSWGLCLTAGSMLSMTDPVAVVAIMKSSGVSPKLVTLISGESLLNDGSSLVMFNVCNALMLNTKEALEEIYVHKESIEFLDIMKYFARLSFGGPVVGLIFGLIFVFFISKAYKTTIHMNGIVQIGLTISCAYTSFFIGEHVLGVSGVLACVVSGIIIGVVGTPQFCDSHGMHNAWHTMEWLLCTMIFLISGVISGNIFFSGEFDFFPVLGFVILCWLVVVVIGRALTMLLFFPLLTRMGDGLSWQGAVVSSWGGLRGAVGIALAIVLRSEFHKVHNRKTGDCLLAVACGVAWLCLTVNGMTMGRLLKRLKMGSVSKEQSELLHQIRKQIDQQVQQAIEDAISEMPDKKTSEDLDEIKSQIHTMCGIASKEEQLRHGSIQKIVQPPTSTDDLTILVRELFLYVVKIAYQEQCKSGQLSTKGSNTVFLILQESVDEALDDLNQLGDFDVLMDHLNGSSCWNEFQNKMRIWTGGVSVHDPPTKCYMLLSFIQAHQEAQKMSSLYVHDYDGVVVQESMVLIARAQAELHKLGNDLQTTVMATRISRLVLTKEINFIENLNEGGVIDGTQTHHLMEDVEEKLARTRHHTQPRRH